MAKRFFWDKQFLRRIKAKQEAGNNEYQQNFGEYFLLRFEAFAETADDACDEESAEMRRYYFSYEKDS